MSLLFQPIETKKKHPLDLNHLLIKDSNSTFFVRIKGHELEKYNIYEEDILIVDRARIGDSHQWYVIIEDGEFFLATLQKIKSDSCEIWGAVTFIIHKT